MSAFVRGVRMFFAHVLASRSQAPDVFQSKLSEG